MTKLYGNYTLTDILKGHVRSDESMSLVEPLARRVAELERELRMFYRADGTAIECASIEEAKALRLEAAKSLHRIADWHTSELVPPPAAADQYLIAILVSGHPAIGRILIGGDVIGTAELETTTGERIPWNHIAAWSYKPRGV